MLSKKGRLSLVVCAIFTLIVGVQVNAQSRRLINATVDDSVRSTIPGTAHPLARSEFDVGPVSSALKMDRMLLVLSPGPDQESQIQTFLDSQQDKNSPDYHRWLTPEEFGQKFGPSPDDLLTVRSWLEQHGFTVNGVARSGRWIEFSGNAQQVQAAFRTQMRQYLIKGDLHMANATEISIPAALLPVVRGVTLHDFFKRPMLRQFGQMRPNPQGGYSYANPAFTSGSGLHALGPADFAKIYDVPALINGVGQSIAIVARGNIETSDATDFQAAFGIPVHSPTVIVNGTDPGFDPNNGDSVEATLDTQWSGAVAQQATIKVVVSGSTATTDGVDLSAAFIVDNDLSPIMSTSFGACEQDLGAAENAFWNGVWQQAAAQGISAFVSSGDNGAAGCDDPGAGVSAIGGQAVSGLASTQFNTAVGGTEFNEGGNDATFWSATNGVGRESAIGYIPEVVWNESCTAGIAGCTQTNLFAGSGGVSSLYAKPSWQQTPLGVTTPADAHRDLPDVSLSAAGHDPYLICFDGSCSVTNTAVGPCRRNVGQISFCGVGGTSASSPSFAGIMAIILSGKGGGRQGLANYQLYKIASTQNFSQCNSSTRTNPATATTCVFNDTTSGNNSVPGVAGFNAVQGYDQGTGLGSVDVNNLVSAWPSTLLTSAATIASTTGFPVTHGAAVALSITVSGQNASPSPTGLVALISSTAGPAGSLPLTASSSTNKATFSGNVNNLPGGTYTLKAHYPGDAVNGPIDSNTINVTINPESSSTALQSFGVDANGFAVAATSFPYGSFMDLHADVSTLEGQGNATGSVTFNEGASTIGSAPMLIENGTGLVGQSELQMFGAGPPTPLTVGIHNITASYSGDSSFNGSTSNSLQITVTKGNPGVALTSQQTTVAAGGSLQMTATVVPTGSIQPTGTAQFQVDGANVGSPVALAGGQGSANITFNAGGTHNVTAIYSGDATYNSATSAPLAVAVTAPFNLTATGGTSATVAAGGTATYNLTLSGTNGFSGTVALTCTGAPAGTTCTVNPANPNLSTTAIPVTVSVATTTSARLEHDLFRTTPFVFAGILAAVFCGFRRKTKPALLVVLAMFIITGVVACGGGGGGGTPVRPPTVAQLTVTGTNAGLTSSITLTLTITH